MTRQPDAVLGFVFAADAFDNPGRYVALVTKARPDWQAGKLNGLGGKLDPAEMPSFGMSREAWEESGLGIAAADWSHKATVRGTDGYMMCVYAASLRNMPALAGAKDEPVLWYAVDRLPENVLPNLRWLIPLCLDDRLAGPVEVTYRRPTTPEGSDG